MTLFRRPKRLLDKSNMPSGKTIALATPIIAYIVGESIKSKAVRALILSLIAAFAAFLSDPEVQAYFNAPQVGVSASQAQTVPVVPAEPVGPVLSVP